MDEPMNGVAEEVVPPESEIRDISFWLETIHSKTQEIEATTAEISRRFGDIEANQRTISSKTQEVEAATAEISRRFGDIEVNTATIREAMVQIATLNEEQEILNSRQEFETSLDTSFNEDKLTPAAKRLINELEPTPLDPQRFTQLMEKCFGKPLPSILPFVRHFSNDIRGICQQLKDFRVSLKVGHREYMTTRRKDENLERRIVRLVDNIERELKEEERDGRRQTSMAAYFNPEN